MNSCEQFEMKCTFNIEIASNKIKNQQLCLNVVFLKLASTYFFVAINFAKTTMKTM